MAQPTEALVRSPAQGRRFVRPLLLAVAVAALLALAWLGYQGWRAYAAARQLRADIAALEALGGASPDAALAEAGPLLARARVDALALRAEAQPLLPLTSLLGWAPVYGPDLAAAGPLLDLAVELTGAADELLGALAPLAPALQASPGLDPGLITELEGARPRLEAARSAAGRASALWASLPQGLSPALQEQLRPVAPLPPLLEAVAGLALAGGHAGPAMAPFTNRGDLSIESPRALVTRLAIARPRLTPAQEELARASEALARVSQGDLPSGLRPHVEQLSALIAQARDLVELALVLPPLLGVDGPHQYLLIAQSPDELRATGGFLSSYGVLTVDRGTPQLADLRDTANVDDIGNRVYPDPPQPLRRYMNSEMWLFRDANWSPDFPTSARQMTELYQLGSGRALTDVVAFDPTALQLILEATGPLPVEGSPVPVGAGNLREYMLAQYNLYWGKSSESFIGPLSSALLERIAVHPEGLDLLALGQAARRALDERHLLISVADPDAAAFLARRDWDGAVRPGDGDFLMVVDSNIGYDKVSSNIDQRVSYTADLREPRAPTGTVSITYTHRLSGPKTCNELDERAKAEKTYESLMISCYQDYLRVLTPGGSRILEAPRRPIPAEWTWDERPDPGAVSARPGEAGTTVLGVYLALPLGGSHETYVRYALPPGVLTQRAGAWRYQLVVQKQPARGDLPYTVRVQLPPGATLVTAAPAPAAQEGQTLVFHVARAAGETIAVEFR